MIRVAVCDDDRALLDGLERALGADPELEVVAVVEAGEQALAVKDPVDVWLMDVQLPGLSGVEVVAEMKETGNGAKVLMMTAYDVGEVFDALEAGVRGFVHKGRYLMNVAAAVKAVYAGYQVGNDVVTAALARRLDRLAIVDPARVARITKDRVDENLLELVLRSYKVEEMAEQVNMGASGVRKRLTRMFGRAGVKNQRALLAWIFGIEDME